ncbi:MAG: SAM-dependent methyltransferase, partial [Chloroflexota bacterium]|nr:SAM-dependent methyltransferase [Chloroflexota bacterium]
MTAPSASSPEIVVVGLGPGREDLLTLETERLLSSADRVWVRTTRHPTLDEIQLGDRLASFDRLYNTLETSEEVYESIARALVDEARAQSGLPVVYAVPGSPSAGERSVVLL